MTREASARRHSGRRLLAIVATSLAVVTVGGGFGADASTVPPGGDAGHGRMVVLAEEFVQNFEVGPIRPELNPADGGGYTATVVLAYAGEWQLDVRARPGEFESIAGTTEINIDDP